MSDPSTPAAGAGAPDAPDAGETPPEAERHAGALVTWSHGQEVLHPTLDSYLGTIASLKDEGAVMCVDVTAVDYLERPARDLPDGITRERFEVVVNLLALEPPRRIRLRVQVPEVPGVVPSLFGLFPGTEAPEREVFDLMGIRFDGHPDLTRILMPEDWEGHPLRKDYPMGRIPVQFTSAPSIR